MFGRAVGVGADGESEETALSHAEESEPGRQRGAMAVVQCDHGFCGLQNGAVHDAGPGRKAGKCWLVPFWLTEVG